MSDVRGADLVDAITEWVDRADEDLDEHDIEAILRIQLAIDASRWCGVDVAELTQGDVASLKHSLREVDAPEFTAWIVDETLRGAEILPPRGPARKAPSTRRRTQSKKKPRSKQEQDDTVDAPASGLAADDATEDPGEELSDDEDLFDAEDADADDDREESPAPGGAFATAVDSAPVGGIFAATAAKTDDLLFDPPSAELGDPDLSAGFFAELDRNTTASVTGPAPVELRDSRDALGPSFLPPSESTGGSGRRIGLFALAAVAVVAFILAGVQLASSINEPDEDEVVVDAEDEQPDESGEEPDDGDQSEENDNGGGVTEGATDDEDDDDDELTPEEAAAQLLATPEPTVAGDLPPAEKTAIVLTEDGDIWSIDLFAEGFGEPALLHDGSERGDATDVSLVSAGIGIVDEDGDAFITSRSDTDERVRVWRSDRLGEARTIVEGSDQYVVLDTTGSVSLFDASRAATRLSIDTVWDATAGGTPPARDIDNYIDLVAFAVGDGDVQLIQTSADDNPLFQIWDGDTQPRAFNVNINERGLFMGVGAGAVARYQWFEDGPPLSAVWDPLAGTRLPAISYAPLDEGTAVVLNNGSVAAIDESGSGPILWDAEVSDLRAVSITTFDDEVLLLLEGGTVLRVAGDGETQNRGSIWDVTDESTSPAIKVLITNP